MTIRYDRPGTVTRVGNEVIRWLAEAGVSVVGTRALRVRGRTTGKLRGVVVNVLTADDKQYLISPRGNTQWVRNARAAGVVQLGPRWHSRDFTIAEVPDHAKPALLEAYLRRWYWEVKGHIGGLTPRSTEADMLQVASSIPVFELQA